MIHQKRSSMPSKNLTLLGVIFALVLVIPDYGMVFAQSDVVPDVENCLLCHRYPTMGRYDKTGTKRIFYVNERVFAKSVHGRLRCKNCHVGIDEIPHTDVDKVNCSTKCHIKEPSTNQEFSHVNMVDKYRASVHGGGSKEDTKPFPDDLPTCKYCHDNRIYNRLGDMWGKGDALSNEILTRCIGCHTKEQWVQNFYSHFTHRMRKRRSQKEIIRLCTSCHEDHEKVERHGLEPIDTYKDTFHWALVKYGVKNAPDCLSCHVPVGYSTHDIRPRTDPLSPLHMANRVKTCSNQGGVQTCHPGATVAFASGRVHAYGIKAQMLAGESPIEVEGPARPLVLKRARADISEAELYHYKVLSLIRLFYKIFIAVVIGSMCLHQLLDFIRAIRRPAERH